MTFGSRAPEWLLLLECTKPHPSVDRLSRLLNEPLNWPALIELADEHGVLALVATRLRETSGDNIPPEVWKRLDERQRAQLLFTLSLSAELFRVLDCLRASARVEALVIKGPILSLRCYGDPGLRQYGDIDLIVRDGDMRSATEAMIALGYTPKVSLAAIASAKKPGEYVFTHKDTRIIIEFHTERTFRYHPRALSIEAAFARQARVRLDAHEVPALSPEDELALICIHGAKHFWTRLLWIADVAALITRQPLDWQQALASARDVGAERMLRVGLHLAAGVLNADLPDAVRSEISPDASGARIALRIAEQLPGSGNEPAGIVRRAAFRMSMRGGGFLRDAAYLMRLSLSATEEDWVEDDAAKGAWLPGAVGRPLRLARKYGRGTKN